MQWQFVSFVDIMQNRTRYFQNGIHITVPSPVLGNVKGPLELQVGMVIIIDKLGDGIVVTTGNHAGRSFLVVN